ncbi:hypothetical protein Taro_035739 [Colocasia esculenta]|uniref:Uncharacterized protein n=1 Tax=Colocasia esculenta TaxID=4460 RepID=A0A843W7K5_COLES|nr:hypothetical protein [Colocasia esculenta]
MASRRPPRSPEAGQAPGHSLSAKRSTGKTVCQSSSSLTTFNYLKSMAPSRSSCNLATSTSCLWNTFFPDAEMTPLKSRSSYDLTAAHRMGYKMVDGIVTRDLKGKGPAIVVGDGEDEEDEEDKDEDEAEDQDAEDSQSEPVDAPRDGDSIAAVDTSLATLADSQVQIQLRLTRLSTHVRFYSRRRKKQGSKIKKNKKSMYLSTARKFPVDRYKQASKTYFRTEVPIDSSSVTCRQPLTGKGFSNSLSSAC